MGIQKKILIWFIIPSILIATTTVAFCYYYTRKALEQNIFSELEAEAEALKEHVRVFLESKNARAKDFSSDGLIKDFTEKITRGVSRVEYYTSALNNHLITNKKHLDQNIHEIYIINFENKIIASTDKDSIGEVVSTARFLTEEKFSSVLVGDPYYDTHLKALLVDFSTILLSKIGREPIGYIVNRIKIEQRGDRIRDGKPTIQDIKKDNPELIAVNKVRLVDFGSDGFIKDYTEEIVRRDEKAFYYADILNTHLQTNKQPLDPDILSVFVVNLDGEVISSTEVGHIGRNVSGEAYFTKTIENGTWTGDLRHPPELRQNGFFEVGVLLFNNLEMEPIGIIVIRYGNDYLTIATRTKISDRLRKEEPHYVMGKTTELYIVNRDKLMITGSRFINDATFKQIVNTVGVQVAFENRRGAIHIYPDYRGVQVLGASRYFEKLSWVLLAEKDASEAFAPLVLLRNVTTILGMVSIIAIVVVSFVISRGITKPLKKLARYSKNIAKGDLTEQIKVISKDEVGSLARSFDKMRLDLVKLLKDNKKARKDWESTFDSISDLIVIYDTDCRLIRCNKALLSKLDVKFDDIIGKQCVELLNLDKDTLSEECAVTQTAKSIKPEAIELEIPCLGGIFKVRAFPHFSDNGDYIGVVQILKDITEQKKVEDHIRKLSHAIEQSSASVVITDNRGKIEYINPKFTKLTGYTREEAMGENPRIISSGETPPEVYKELWKTITSGNEWRGVFSNRKKNGELYWESASISPVKDDKGVITNFIAVKDDITEQKRAQEQLMRSHKMVSLGQQAAGVCHEILNPINIISSHVQLMLMEAEKGSNLEKDAKSIQEEVKRVVNITDGLLRFSRNETPTTENTEVNDLLENVIPIVEHELKLRNIDIIKKLEGELPEIKVNINQLRQVFLNLINNAYAAMPKGGTLTVKTQRIRLFAVGQKPVFVGSKEEKGSEPKENFIEIIFEDSGCGISSENIEKIFNPFFTTKKEGEGTGLGLSESYKIVENHGGKLHVQSRKGKGSTFTIDLPVKI